MTTQSAQHTPGPWKVVQSTATGLYHVIRHAPGAREDDQEFLSGPSGLPRSFKTGEAAHAATHTPMDRAVIVCNALRGLGVRPTVGALMRMVRELRHSEAEAVVIRATGSAS